MPAEHNTGRCRCGCGQATEIAPHNSKRNGWTKGEPKPWVRYHHLRKSPVEYIEDEAGCWVWQGGRTKEGYGIKRNAAGGCVGAHRWYYEQAHGPIPAGLHLDHLCRKPLCVNPAHLEPVTPAENARRGATPILTLEKAREIRASGDSPRVLAQRYGVTKSTIGNVRQGRAWREAS